MAQPQAPTKGTGSGNTDRKPDVFMFPDQLKSQLETDLKDAKAWQKEADAPKDQRMRTASRKSGFFTDPEDFKTLEKGLAAMPGAIPPIRHYVEIKSFHVDTESIGKDIQSILDNIWKAKDADKSQVKAFLDNLLKIKAGSNKLAATIYLHIPNNLQEPDVVLDYLDTDMVNPTLALATAKAMVDTGFDPTTDWTTVFGKISGRLGEQGFTPDVLLHFLPHLISKFAGFPSVENVLKSKTGMTINPMQTSLFKGVQLRTFSLTWSLSPKTEQEANAIFGLISFLKVAIRPRTTNSRFLFDFPNEFEVSFKTGARNAKIKDNPYLFKSGRCVVTGMSINPTAAGKFSAFGLHTATDGMPVQTDLTLQFKELKVVTATAIEGNPLVPGREVY